MSAQRNVYVPKHFDTLNVIVLYSSHSAKNTKFPNIDINGKNLTRHHYDLIKKRFNNEKQLNIIYVYGNENDIHKHVPNDVTVLINENYESNGDSRSLNLALYNCKIQNCLIIDGKHVWSDNMLDNVTKADFSSSFVLLGKDCDNSIGSIIDENKTPELLMFNSPNKYSGVTFISEQSMPALRKMTTNKNTHKLLTFELINDILKKDKTIKAILDNTIRTESCL